MGEIAFSAVLALAAILAVLASARAGKTAHAYLMFAAALYAGLAAGDTIAALTRMPELAEAIALLVSALAPASLALAMAGRAVHGAWAMLVLLACLVFALFAAASGEALAAFAPLFASVCAMLAMAIRRRQIHAGLGALCFLAAAASFMADARMGLALFSAAGLIGVALGLNRKVAGLGKNARRLAVGR